MPAKFKNGVIFRAGFLYFGCTMAAPEQDKPPVFSSWAGWYRLVLFIFLGMVVLLAIITRWMS